MGLFSSKFDLKPRILGQSFTQIWKYSNFLEILRMEQFESSRFISGFKSLFELKSRHSKFVQYTCHKLIFLTYVEILVPVQTNFFVFISN